MQQNNNIFRFSSNEAYPSKEKIEIALTKKLISIRLSKIGESYYYLIR